MTGPKPLRCAQMIETLTVGGAENLAVRLANGLAAAGLESHMIVIEELGPLAEFLSPEVTLHFLDVRRAPIGNPVAFGTSVRRGYGLLRDVVRGGNLDVVQSHLPGANYWGLLLARRGLCEVVATVHNNREFDYGEKVSRVRARLRKTAYRSIVSDCAATVAVSEEVKTSLIRELGLDEGRAGRIVAVPNGVPIPEPLAASARQEIRARYGVPAGVPLVLAAGRHCEQKNFRDLVSAAGRLAASGVVFRLVITGSGSLTPDLAAQVKELGLDGCVDLPGDVMGLTSLMQAADLFVIPSLWEGLPLVLLEAMATGVPVVGNRIDGIQEVVTDGVNGVLAEPGSPLDLADRMQALLTDSDRSSAIGTAGRESVHSTYSLARVIADVSTLYRTCFREKL